MPLKTLDTQVPEPEGWFQPSPARALSQSDKKARELLVQSRPWDWGSSIVKISPDFDTESFEDLLDDIQDLSFSTDEKHKTLRAIYPPQETFNSNVLILQKDSHPESENASFINVLRTAYGSDGAQTGVNSFRVNLVLKGLKTVHSFDFSDEAEYWRFLNGVRKGNRGEMENYVTGLCRLIGAHTEEDAGQANKKLLGFNIGKLPKLSTAKAPGLDGQGRFIINHNILTFKSFGPKGQLLDDEEIINLMDAQELLLQIIDVAHQVDIGQQSFTPHGILAEYKPAETSFATPSSSSAASSIANGTYSPKPNKRSSGLSVVRFSEMDVSSSSYSRHSVDLNNNGAMASSSHRGSGKFAVHDPVVKLSTTQRVDTLLLSKGGERALKLVIKNASGLVATNGKVPAVYCTIYLAGKNGQRLTSNVAEMRTEPVKSLDPEWKHEIIIHDERLAKQEVEFVMVLLRDQSSGLLKHRHVGQDVGQNLAAIQLFKATALPASTTTSLSINSGPNSPVALARTRAPSVGRASFFSSGGNNAAMTNAARLGTFGIVETIRDTAEVIEGLFKDLQYADEGTASGSVSSSPQPTSSSAAAAFGAASLSADVTSLTEVQRHWEQSLLRQILLYLRCKLVPAILPHIPDHEELPDFSIAYIQRAVEKDKLFYQMMVPWRVNEKMEALHERYDSFMEESLRPYVQSKATFQAIPGQWLKNCVLKLLIEKNHQYESYIGTTLRVNGLYLTQERPLALVENVDEVLDWFATTLLQDTRLWLSKTIEQARNKRENTYELPWDTELVGDRICSHLPESVSFQLKVFMDVCVKDFSSGRSRHHLTSGAGETTSATGGPPPPPPPPPTTTSTSTVARSLFGDHTTRSTRAKADFYQVANERLLQAIAQAWILLANEYERSLLSKHWDQVKPKPEQDAYIEYLCAIANDCYRIRRDQIMALTDIRVRDDKKHELLNHLHVAFRNLQSQALGYVLRIVYSTVQRTLIDFEDLWLNPTDEQHAQHTSYATRTLLSNVRTWMLRMKQKVEYKVYRELLPNAVEVVVLRFFILFREILAQKNGPPLRVEDLTKLTQDVEILSSMLEDLCEHDGDASYDGLDALKGGSGDIPATEAALAAATRPLGPKLIEDCVKDVLLFFHTFVMLLREPVASVQFQASLHWLLYDYEHIYQANHPPYFVEFLLVHCLVPLRPPQTVNDADAFITQYHQMAIMAPPRSTAATAAATANNGDAAAAEATGTAVVYGNVAAISGKRKARRNLDQHDLYWRIFGGNNKILDAMGEAYEAAGCTKPQAVAAATGSGSGGMSATAAATFKFFSPSLAARRLAANGAAAAGGATGSVGAGAAGGGGSGGVANGGGKSLLPLTKVVGGDLFKPLREKAADLRVFHNHRRQNEEIMAIYRLLGLGGAANEEDEDGGPSSGSGGHGGGGGGGGSTSGKVRPARGLFGSHASGDGDEDGGDSLSALEHAAGANGGASANGSTITPRALISLVASVTGGGSSSHLIPANAHGTTYTGFIKISHIEVRKLHSAALFGECHPYIYFSMGAQRQKTSVKATGHAATWDDIVVLKVPSNLDVTTATMHVEVFDKELIRRKRLLGEVSIKLDGLDMRDFDSWFALEGGECAGVGEIHVKISLQKLTR
eukprot:gene10138-7227_t